MESVVAKISISFEKTIDGLLLDASNRIAVISQVKDVNSKKQYRKIGKVFGDKLMSGEEAILFDTEDDSWIEVDVTESNTPASESPEQAPLVGIVEPAAA